MKRLDDQKIRSAFSENEERPNGQDFEKENLWLRIEQQLPKRRILHLNWYRSVASIIVLVVLSGWSITLLKYNQIKTVNQQLTYSIEVMESVLQLQKKQIAEIPAKPEKESYKKEEYKAQLSEKRNEQNLLQSENEKLKTERQSLILTNDSLHKRLYLLSLENNLWADSLRSITEKISESKELPLATIETPHEPERPAENRFYPNAKTEVYVSDLDDKRPGRRLRIQLFNPGEHIENSTEDKVSIFKLFK